MSSKILIGKHTLESLTSGMYSDPFVVYREYVQNAVDSIDAAVRKGLLKSGEEKVIVHLTPVENIVSIRDNGIGIPSKDAEIVLISIGNSKKTSDTSRGFRGIGRLSGLSYCKTLSFFTSFSGEKVATRITIEADKLAMLLSDNSFDISVKEVLSKVYSIEMVPEKSSAHYFEVELNGIDMQYGLCDFEKVKEYVSQNIPVPYKPDFAWGKEIINRIRREGHEIKAYNVLLKYGIDVLPVYKPYCDRVLVDKRKNVWDTIDDIEIIRIPLDGKKLFAIGWIANTNYLGSIYDKSVKGIRFRKGNIQIGDHQTLNTVFKDARFNGWAVGEIFAVDVQLIPNARRDNFEKNAAYFLLLEQLSNLAAKITKEIREASLQRNKGLSNAINKMNEASELAERAISQGISSSKKSAISQKLKSAQEALSESALKDASDEAYQTIAFEELDILIGQLKGATEYKALNTIKKLTTTEKKILARVFNVIDDMGADSSTEIVDAILGEFS